MALRKDRKTRNAGAVRGSKTDRLSISWLQMSFTCLPYHEGVLVVMLNQTFTDKVAGFGSGIAHRIGRGRVADAIAETFDLIRTAVK